MNTINKKTLKFIEDKIIEWKGKTISSNKHFTLALEKTLLETALFVSLQYAKKITKQGAVSESKSS